MKVAQAIDACKEHMQTLGLAHNTVYCQTKYLEIFGRTCEQVARERGKRSGLDVREIDSQVISRYFARCKGKQGARNNWTVVVRRFLKFCEMERYLPPGEMARLLDGRKLRPYEREPKHYVPVEQFGDLLDSGERHPVDRAIIALALYTLCRRSELVSLRLQDVDLDGLNLKVYRQKRKRWTDITICPELREELSSWLGWMASSTGYTSVRHMMSVQPDWLVIPALVPLREKDDRGRFSGQTDYEIDPMSSPTHLERVVKRALDYTGAVTPDGQFVKHFTEGMHTIRRSGARAMFKHLSTEVGKDDALLTVSVMLDHEDTLQTIRYIGLNEQREDLNRWLRTNSPFGTAPAARALRSIA